MLILLQNILANETIQQLTEQANNVQEDATIDWLNIFIAAVVAVTGIVVAIITWLGYKEERKFKEFEKKKLYADTATTITAEYQNLFSTILSNDDLKTELINRQSQISTSAILDNFFINHVYVQYYYNKQKLIEDSEWISYEKEIISTFKSSGLQKRWETSKQYYSDEFKEYIKKIIDLANKEIKEATENGEILKDTEETLKITKDETMTCGKFTCPCPCRKRKNR